MVNVSDLHLRRIQKIRSLTHSLTLILWNGIMHYHYSVASRGILKVTEKAERTRVSQEGFDTQFQYGILPMLAVITQWLGRTSFSYERRKLRHQHVPFMRLPIDTQRKARAGLELKTSIILIDGLHRAVNSRADMTQQLDDCKWYWWEKDINQSPRGTGAAFNYSQDAGNITQ